MALINFMGGIGAVGEGYRKGAREAAADDKRAETDAFDSKALAAKTDLLPLATEASRLAAQNQIEQSKSDAATAPDRAITAAAQAKSDAALSPSMAVYKQAEAVKMGTAKMADAHDSVLGQVGEYMANGDLASVTETLNSAAAAPNIFPALNGMGKVVKTEIAAAPAGATEIGGRPITGNAIKITLEDGTQKFIDPAVIKAPYQKLLAQREFGARVPLKAGESLVNGLTGKTFATNDNGYGEIGTDADGNPITGKVSGRMGPNGQLLSGGGAGGTGAGAAGGKKAPNPVMDRIHNALDKDQTINSAQRVAAGSYADSIASVPGLNLGESDVARAATLAATDPKTVAPGFNIKTGTVDNFFRHPEVAGGAAIPIASGVVSPSTFLAGMKPADVQAKLGEMLQDMSGGNPAVAEKWMSVARDPAQAKAAVADAAQSRGPAYAAVVQRRLGLLSQLPGAPAQKPAATAQYATPAAPAAPVARSLPAADGGFGLVSSNDAAPDSPAARAQTRRAASAAATAGATYQTTQSHQQAASELATQFQSDSATMSPIELSRKYDALRGNLSPQDAAALQAAEKTIR